MKPRHTIFSTKVICKEPGRYIGWPTVTRTHRGELLAVFSGDRDAHVCPWGKTQMVRSIDEGKTWSEPITINDTPLDDRDAGIVETRNGTLIVSWFTSVYFAEHEAECRKWYGDVVVNGWKERIATAGDAKIRQQYLGNWVRRSTDNGKTWSNPISTKVSSPHGPVVLKSGRLAYLGNNGDPGSGRLIQVEGSDNDGKDWDILGTVPIPKEKEEQLRFCEPHMVETQSGKLVAMFRVEPNKQEDRFLYQSESFDGGRTWLEPQKTAIWGHPPHLIRLQNGVLVVVYGYRRPPYGERACISRDEGKTWDAENGVVLCNAFNGDLGYPASAELGDGSIFTVYYQVDQAGQKPCLMGTHWCAGSGTDPDKVLCIINHSKDKSPLTPLF